MARLLSTNGLILSLFDTIRLKLSTTTYFMVLFHSMLPKNVKILKINFRDVFSMVLYGRKTAKELLDYILKCDEVFMT